jgi:hypothetical protein
VSTTWTRSEKGLSQKKGQEGRNAGVEERKVRMTASEGEKKGKKEIKGIFETI